MLPFDIHTHQSISRQPAVYIRSYSLSGGNFPVPLPEEMVSLGLHPWYTTAGNFDASFKNLENMAQSANVKMIGECGLDKIQGETMALQISFLEKQIALAEHLKKPLILHCVKAFQELIALKEKHKVKVPMIIHGFNKSKTLGQQLIQKGFHLSFGKAILNPVSNAAQLLKQIDHFFLETDDSDVEIEEIYRYAAILKNCEAEQLKERIFADWKKITDF